MLRHRVIRALVTWTAAALFLGAGAGVAHAEEIVADPSSPSQGPAVDGGVRSGTHGELRTTHRGGVRGQGQVREPMVAVPGTRAGAPPIIGPRGRPGFRPGRMFVPWASGWW